MTKITLRKEVRNIITKILEEQGIYTEAIPPNPSIVDLLTDAVLGISRFRALTASERFKAPQVGRDSLEMARKRLMLSEKVEALLQITPDLKDKAWIRVLNRIIDAEEKGDSFEKYAEWFKAGTQYDRPKTFQIVKNPNIIFGNWKEAQSFLGTNESAAPYEIG